MKTDTLRNEPITTMFADRVKPDKTKEYEAWSTGINASAKEFPGFLGVDVIRPDENNHPEYITLVKFDSCDNLKGWRESPSLAKSQKELPDMLVSDSFVQVCEGLELWFDRPTTTRDLKEPPLWKQVIIGVVCVYPLVLLLNWGLGPVTQGIPKELAVLISVIILSTLLTYPVMPWVTRLLRAWLYPK